MTPRLAVIGGASLDVLHLRDGTVRSAGGAGLYTSLAAARAGARVTMVGPRPQPMPEELAAAAERIDWRGETVLPEELPSFEIAHHGGGRSRMESAVWRAEAGLDVSALPEDLAPETAYLIPMPDPRRQLEFVRHFKARGATVACGTFGAVVSDAPQAVREILAAADVFFCNRDEARGLFGSLDEAHTAPGKLLFVTLSAGGARVIQGDHATDVPAVAVEEVDPTGAGDTFCGTVLALLAQGAHPVMAARQACAAAAETVTEIGPAALLRRPPPPSPPADPRVAVDLAQVGAFAELLAGLPDARPFPFVGEPFPDVDDPGALDFFFAATLQQFGFWTSAGGRYRAPTIARLGGRELKGSDYLWAVTRRWLDEDPGGLRPRGQERLDAATLERRWRCDGGDNPLPSSALRLELARAYGRDMTALGWTPAGLVEEARAAADPLLAFLTRLDHVAGYKEDPLRKKSALLALVLKQRPERFLPEGPVPPVVDYHIQRSCLRTGLVVVEGDDLRRRLEAREILEPADEWALRLAAWEAMVELQAASGRSMGAIDWFFFQNRRRCPEMSAPDCGRCPADPACAHRKELFQPVLRTSFY